MMNNKEIMLRKLGIKPDGISKANVVQGSKGRLVIELEYYNGDIQTWYYRGIPSVLAGPLPDTAYLNWIPCSNEEFDAMGPI